MLNKIIKIDLHIHSYASYYKERDGIVDNSTADNLNTLFEKLQENAINLFSITDHNRFDSSLYLKAKEILKNNTYPAVKEILPGVEFDVKLEEDKKTCHIITIFHVTNYKLDYKHIEYEINNNLLTGKEDFYSKDDFEKLLKDIGFDVILIACQRTSLDNSNGNHSSLNDSTDHPYEFIKVGYINALEYQKPNVQGILLKNLKDFDQSVGLITGSDCHDWTVYPSHDKTQLKQKMYYSKIKILPSFKGLLMAITSPKTRFDRSLCNNSNFIRSISINGNTYLLDSGINAIIGENGSGKSTLIKIITHTDSEKYVKRLIAENELSISNSINDSRTKIVQQSEIINKFNEGKLFKDNDGGLFKKIDNTEFEDSMNSYAIKLYDYLTNNIGYETMLDDLENHSIILNPEFEESTYFITISYPPDFTKDDNCYEERKNNLNKIIGFLQVEIDSDFYQDEQLELLKNASIAVKKVYAQVNSKYLVTEREKTVRNIIINKINAYNASIASLSNSLDRDKSDYNKNKEDLKDQVVSIVKKSIRDKNLVNFPKPVKGSSSNETNGFIFSRIAGYHDADLKNDFFKMMFNKGFNNEGSIKSIKTYDELATAIKGANNTNYKTKWEENLKKFIDSCESTKGYILDSNSKKNVGNTMGEISLVYYKYHTFNNNNWDVLIVDQPEDNISNNRISTELIKYLDYLRNSKKQIIFVTHNPLLVVNLDVDNVLYLEKNNEKINVVSGCLEDEENNVLEIIANNMDGGKDMIEKRLNLYEKDY